MNGTTSTPPAPDVPAAPDAPAAVAQPRRGRRRKAFAALGIVAIVAICATAGVFLFSGGSSANVEAYRNTPPKSVKYIDGLVIKATGSTFVLKKPDHKLVTLNVRQPDRPYIDVQHAQTHASLGQPVRVFWKTIDKHRSVVYMADSPLIF